MGIWCIARNGVVGIKEENRLVGEFYLAWITAVFLVIQRLQSGPGGNVECNGHRKERICIVMSEVNRRPSYPTALIIFDVLTDSPKCHPSK